MIGRVHLLPTLLPERGISGGTAIVIDVLRATTTMCQALASGAREIRPCLEVADARRTAHGMERSQFVLGGERGGRIIDGFDLGNSPGEYTRDRVAGKSLVFTTTNGTRAIHAAGGAARIVLAALVNRAAVCRAALGAERLDIVCAGTNGSVTQEDVLAAGAIVARLQEVQQRSWNDEALAAAAAWNAIDAERHPAALVEALRDSGGGQNLVELGFDADIEAAARLDTLAVVPVVERRGGVLHVVPLALDAAAANPASPA